MNLTLRSEKTGDYKGISRVNDIAFRRTAEAKLVTELRKLKAFDSRLSVVAESNGEIVGYILLTPVSIEGNGEKGKSLALAPMAVLPEYQKRSIGKLLVIFSLQLAKESGYESVVVVGHPSYYPKLGFKRASDFGLRSPFPAPDEAFMAMELVPGSLKKVKGQVIFPDPFDKV